VAPPPGWVPPVPASPPPDWNTPLPTPPGSAKADEGSPVPNTPAPAGESGIDRPERLRPFSSPLWQPEPRGDEAGTGLTYDLPEPSRGPPVVYTQEPDFLTRPAKFGLMLIGIAVLVGAGAFVLNGSQLPRRPDSASLLEPVPEPVHAPVETKPTPAVAPRPTPAPVVKVPETRPETPIEKEKSEPKPAAPLPLVAPPERKPPPLVPPQDDPSLTGLVFEKHVLPIFKAKCIACHGSRKKGGVDIRSVDALVGSGEPDGVLVRGSITKSRLWRALDTDTMPKAGKKLTAAEKDLIQRWIMTGAKSVPRTPPPLLPRAP
jgi:mono/diheme cytochrome c family protein